MIADLPLFAAVAALPEQRADAQAPRKTEKRAARAPRVKPSESACCVCAQTWSALCDRASWFWTDYGFIGMTGCSRCGRNVCVYCRTRYKSATLCPACFELPEPTKADARSHVLSRSHGDDYAFAVMRDASWRYEKPSGQFMPISPPIIWYAQTYRTDREPASKAEKRERDHRWSVVNGWVRPNLLDATWLPPEILAYLEASGGDGAADWSDEDGDSGVE